MFCSQLFYLVLELFITPRQPHRFLCLCGSVSYIPSISELTAHSCLPFPRFLKGLPVTPALLSDKLKAALGMDPSPGGIKYIIATQVRPGTSHQPQGPGAPAAQHTWGGPSPTHRLRGLRPGLPFTPTSSGMGSQVAENNKKRRRGTTLLFSRHLVHCGLFHSLHPSVDISRHPMTCGAAVPRAWGGVENVRTPGDTGARGS